MGADFIILCDQNVHRSIIQFFEDNRVKSRYGND